MARRGENIYKRKDGRYEGRYIRTRDENGKAIYGYVYARSYSDVKEKLAEYKAVKKKKPTGSSGTLSQWLDFWLGNAGNLKETTRQIYRGHIRNYILPKLGKVRLKKLTTQTLQAFVSSLKLSPSTVKVIFCVLKSALIFAEERGQIMNIWSRVKLPKKAKTEVSILTLAEQKRLERVLSRENDIGILLCLYTGLRIGELCALKWSDIDFEKSVIHVNGTQARVGGTVKILPPKSKTSLRTIPVPNFIMEKLKNQHRDGAFVLSMNGRYVNVRTYRRQFKRLLEEAQLPNIKFHALRHTFSTRALEVGMDFKTLSEILGHSTVAITLDLYVHSLDEHKRSQMNKLGEIYSPSN